MAALSVQKIGGGRRTGTGARFASVAPQSSRLDATPPDTRYLRHPLLAGGAHGLGDERLHDRLLEGGRYLRPRQVVAVFARQTEHGRLQAAEAEIVAAAQHGARQTLRQDRCRRHSRRRLLDRRAAGEAEAQKPRHLVERLAGGVVAGAAQQTVTAVIRPSPAGRCGRRRR